MTNPRTDMFAVATLALFLQLPAGFPAEDPYTSANEACMDLAFDAELVPKEHQAQVFDWCQRRTHASSRGRDVRSRIDGSWIHDRDRPAAWPMYRWGLKAGLINPGTCEHDRVDTSVRHSKAARKLAANWPFQNPELTESKRRRWMSHSADYERFGTRGPHDNNVTVARMALPGCWEPEALDRYDVAVTVTVVRAAQVCERHGCRNNADIAARW